ncbi:hypothetical protein SLE2022_385200 [Rubroshorea leprosula]
MSHVSLRRMECKNLVLSWAMLLLVTVTSALASRNEVIGRFSSVSNIRNALSNILLSVNVSDYCSGIGQECSTSGECCSILICSDAIVLHQQRRFRMYK